MIFCTVRIINKNNMPETTVINVRLKNIRPEFINLSEWINNPANIYIGRCGIVFINKKRFPTKSSVWSNPFKIKADSDRNAVLVKYEMYIRDKIEKKECDIAELVGKKLGCWCSPLPCHGDVLCKIINENANNVK